MVGNGDVRVYGTGADGGACSGPRKGPAPNALPCVLCSSLAMRQIGGSATSWTDVNEPRETAVAAGAATAKTKFDPHFLQPHPTAKQRTLPD